MAKQKPSQQTHTEPTCAAELLVDIENGDADTARARVQTLSQRDFINVTRSVQALERMLSDYALSWQDSQFWGFGHPFPDEAKAKAKAARA